VNETAKGEPKQHTAPIPYKVGKQHCSDPINEVMGKSSVLYFSLRKWAQNDF
jgi:hypothetical protein